MAYDGSIKIDTQIDSSGIQSGLNNITSAAKKGIGAVTTAITATSATLGGIATKAIGIGSGFEEGMSQVQAISGATGKELEALTEKAKEMGAKTKFSARESAEAMNYMAMAGWKTSDMLDGIEGIMNLAAASGENLGTVSDIVTDALTAFGLEASDSAHFADVLAKAASNSNTNVSMMGETFKYAAPLAGALKYSIEDTAVAVGLMANAGIKGTQAGTTLRSMLTRLADPPKEAASALESLGISITNADGSVKPLRETLKDLRERFAELSDAEKTEYASNIAGQEAMSGLLALVNASEEDYEKLTEAIDNASGAAAEQSAVMQDNLAGSITILKSTAESLGIEFYESIQEPLKEIADDAQQMLESLNRAFKEEGMQGLVEEMGRIMAQILKKVTEAAPKMIRGSADLIVSFLKGIKQNAPKISEAAVEIGKELIGAFTQIIPEVAAIGSKIISELLRTLFGRDLGKEAEKLCNSISKEFSKLSGSLKSAAGKAMEIIGNIVSTLLELAQMILPLVSGAIRLLADNIDWLLPLLTGFVTGLAAFKTFSSIVGAIDGIKNSIMGVGTAIQALSGMSIVGIILAAVAGVTALAVAFGDAKMAGDEYLEVAREYRDQVKEETDAIHEQHEAYRKTEEARKKSNDGITAEYGQYQILLDELKRITDANGKIKKGYEDRAAVITTTLSDALGIEIDTVDGVIQKYDELTGSIEDLILKKEAEAMLSANEGAYTEAVQNQIELFNQVKDAQDDVSEAQERYNKQVAETNRLEAELKNNMDPTRAMELVAARDASKDAEEEYQAALADTKAALKDVSDMYGSNQAVIENYGNLMTAIATGDVETMNGAIAALSANMRTAETADKETLLLQLQNYKDTYAAMKTAVEEGGIAVSDEQMKQLEYLIEMTRGELDKLDQAASDGMERTGMDGASSLGKTDYAYVDAAGSIVAASEDELEKLAPDEIMKRKMKEGADGIRSAKDDFKNATRENREAADASFSLGDRWSLGYDFAKGYAKGILGGSDVVGSAASSLVDIALGKIRSTQRSNSPAKATIELGEDNSEGFAIGIKNNEKDVEKSAEEITEKALTRMKGSVGGISGVIDRFKRVISGEKAMMSIEAVAASSKVISDSGTTAENVSGSERPIYTETHVHLGDETELAIALVPALRKELAFE